MSKFIIHFRMAWKDYPRFRSFMDHIFTEEQREALHNADKDPARSRRMYRSRLYYAFDIARMHYRHRDRYSKKCYEAHGNCDICNARHC